MNPFILIKSLFVVIKNRHGYFVIMEKHGLLNKKKYCDGVWRLRGFLSSKMDISCTRKSSQKNCTIYWFSSCYLSCSRHFILYYKMCFWVIESMHRRIQLLQVVCSGWWHILERKISFDLLSVIVFNYNKNIFPLVFVII